MTNSLGTQGANAIKNMNLLRLIICHFMVYKDYKIGLKFVFPICGINFTIQHLTCSLIDHCATIYHNIFLKSFPVKFPNCIFHQSLIIYFLINDLLLLKFIQTRDTGGVSKLKIIFLYSVMVSLIASPSSSFVFIQFWWGIFNFFASSNKDVLFIYYFVTPSRLQKSFKASFYTSKHSSSSLSMLHCCFSALVYWHSSTYTWGWYFLPCL